MGEAKRRKLAGEMPYQQHQVVLNHGVIEEAAEEARQLFAAKYVADSGVASNSCHALALILEMALKKRGMNAQVAGGYCTWRCGRGPGDTLVNHPSAFGDSGGMNRGQMIIGQEIIGHYWVNVDNTIIDATLAFFKDRVALNDAQDGYKTVISWDVPKTLITSKDDPRMRKNCHQVTQSYDICYAYEPRPEFNQILDFWRLEMADILK